LTTIVTGGSGYIGWNLLRELDLREVRYRNIDIKEDDDILDGERMLTITEGADRIIHLAADPDVQTSIRQPVSTNMTNVNGTLNMLECARRQDASFVFISSFAAMDIQSPYGLQKHIGEEYCRLYSKLYGIKCLVLRLSNLYGGANYVDNKESVIAVFTKQMAEGLPLTVFGGDQTRDFVHVDDVVRGILGSLDSPKGFEIYEISSGVETSIRGLTDLFKRFNPELEVETSDYRTGEVMNSVGDPSLAREDFGYAPSVDLVEGIQELVDLMKGD
jgi:UDP-glucose 4-epimerase